MLLKVEPGAERRGRAAALAEWDRDREQRKRQRAEAAAEGGEAAAAAAAAQQASDDEEEGEAAALAAAKAKGGASAATSASIRAHVPVVDQEEMERRVLAKRKEDLMEKYASADLVASESEAKKMLNVE